MQLLFTYLDHDKLDKPTLLYNRRTYQNILMTIADLSAKQLTLQQSIQNKSSSITNSTTHDQMETNSHYQSPHPTWIL